MRLLALVLLSTVAMTAQSPRELSLRGSIELALQQSPQIQIAKLRTLESRGQYGLVRSGYLPQITATARDSVATNNLRGIGLSFPGVPSRIGPFQVFDARPRVSQTVFNLSLLHDMSAARKRIQQSDFDAVSLREAVLLGVVDLYLRTLQADARQEATRARLTTAERLAEQAEDFLEVGSGNRLDFVRSRSQVETETALLAQQVRDRETSKLLLLETIGLPVETEIRLTESLDILDSPASDIAAAEQAALSNRPEVKAAELKLEAAGLDVKSARMQRLPTIGFEADYGVLGQRINRNLSTYTIAGTLSMPIFQGGRIQAETRVAKARQEQVVEELRDVENNVRLDVRAARIQLDSAIEAAQAARRAGEAADEGVELAQLRFEVGLTSNIDVIQAQQEQTRADELEIATLYDLYLARANYAKAQGDIAAFLP